MKQNTIWSLYFAIVYCVIFVGVVELHRLL